MLPADAGLEALREYQDEAAYDIIGGELVLPRLMGVRLRELRSVMAAQARFDVLDEIYLELKKASTLTTQRSMVMVSHCRRGSRPRRRGELYAFRCYPGNAMVMAEEMSVHPDYNDCAVLGHMTAA